MASASKFDPKPPDRSDYATQGIDYAKADKPEQAGVSDEARSDDLGNGPPDVDWIQLIARADQISTDYQSRTIQKPLARSYRAWRNQHGEGSKYLGPAYRGRSRLFVPKTRSAVRKNLATAAAALFSTDDIVNISAQYEDDSVQRATAATIKADLDYRMTRTGAKSGIPWFLIAMGACLDAQLTAVSISKQYWDYEEVTTKQKVVKPVVDEITGEPAVDPLTGEPLVYEAVEDVVRVTRDRPMCDLYPLENAGIDPAAPWHSPVQGGRWFIMRHPIGLDDAKAMMASADKRGENSGWLEVSDADLLQGRSQDDRSGARRVREGGGDRYEDSKSPGHLDIVWLQENFIRISGVDWHFWSVGRFKRISEVRRVEEVYPAFGGERPYVMGSASIDTHQVFPMSPVESWQPLQLELNDITNLRQDTLKRAIAPIAKAKRGKNVDLAQLQRRGQPDTVLMLDNLDDVAFEATPGPSGASYTETSVNNAMFDELAGVFSTSSVQANRQLNETVGGMRLMSGAANSVSEFDLRMWVETWVEPVIRQLAHLIKYYETDERLLTLSAANAKTMQKQQVMPTFDDFEAVELMVRVNVGIGASDPMQKLGKLKAAFEMLAPIMPIMQAQGVEIDAEAVVQEVMGAAGFRDGLRFFKFGDAPQQQPDAELMKFMEEMKLEREKMANDLKEAVFNVRAENERNRLDNETRVAVEKLRQTGQVGRQLVGVHAERERRQSDTVERGRDRMAGFLKDGQKAAQKNGAAQRAGNDFQKEIDDRMAAMEERETQIIEALAQIAARLPGAAAGVPVQGRGMLS